MTQPHPQFSIDRLPQVKAATGYPRATLYAKIKAGLFVRPVAIGARAVGWPAHEVAAMNAARICGKTDDEIRALVARLEADRKALVPGGGQ